MTNIVKRKILGVDFSIISQKGVLEYIIKNIPKKTEKYYIVTPNPEILVIAQRDLNYQKVLNYAKLALPDGVGIMWAGKVLGVSLKGRIPGADLMENLCKAAAKQPITVSFVGSRPGIADKAAECLKNKYSSLKIVFTGSEVTSFERLKGTDILFVAFGSPKQEFWMAKNLKKLPVKLAIGVGGAFDFASGEVTRAPLIVRWLGLEWLFRLIMQPWRAKRQFSLLLFIYLVLREKFRLK